MGIGAGELTKLDHAINAALLLVHVALRSGDRAGMLAFSDTVTGTLPPRAGTAQLRRFLDATRPIQPGETEADYDDAFTFYSRWQTRRSLVVIFTDVLDPDQGKALDPPMRSAAPQASAARRDGARSRARRCRQCRPANAATKHTRAQSRADSSLIATIPCDVLRSSGVETIDADARTLVAAAGEPLPRPQAASAPVAGRARREVYRAVPAKFLRVGGSSSIAYSTTAFPASTTSKTSVQ